MIMNIIPLMIALIIALIIAFIITFYLCWIMFQSDNTRKLLLSLISLICWIFIDSFILWYFFNPILNTKVF